MVSLEELVGLVGITVVISVGKIFEPMRNWLRGFVNPYNPLRWLGEMWACSMCAGWWVGFCWGLYLQLPYARAILLGGFISIAAYVLDTVMAVLEGLVRRIIRPPAPQFPLMQAPQPRKVHPGESISEEEAHALVDAEQDDDPNWAQKMMTGTDG